MDPNAVFAELQETLRHMRDEISFLREQFATVSASIPPPVIPTPSRPKPSLPHPDKFAGDARKYDTWLASIKAKLAVDSPAIGDNIAQFNYVFLNLESTVQSIVLPQLETEPEQLDYHTILTSLSRIYANPHKIREAKDRLNKLTQGTDSLTTYIAKFERLLGEARIGHYPDDAKIEAFRKGLPRTTQQRLSERGSEPTTLDDYIMHVQQVITPSLAPFVPHTSTSATQAPTTPRPFVHGHARKPSTHYAGDPMDVNSLEVVEED
jgi:hypothetical protein